MRRLRCEHCARPVHEGVAYCPSCGGVVAAYHETETPLRPPAAMLLIYLPGRIVSQADLTGQSARIGRSDRCEIVVDHPHVSRHHATVEYHDGAYWLSDARSTGGTLVNDRPVHEPRRLVGGDTIRLGRLAEDVPTMVYREGQGPGEA